VLLSRGKRSDDEQSWNSAWVTAWARLPSPFGTCTCTYYWILMGSAICLLTLPTVVCPILTPWNCTFIPLPLFCRVDVVKFRADACRWGRCGS